jgi:ADP-ribosyl-[dinitrogen reductase] hydrolase
LGTRLHGPNLRNGYPSRYRGCLLGLACGHAVGTTVEFSERGSFPPVTDMVGGGPFHLPAGAWTDDTSMALCLATSLVELGRFDPADQMRRYCAWHERGYLSSTGRCFDIGLTVRGALARYQKAGNPFAGLPDPHSAGNGCIMRLAPVPMFFHPDVAEAVRWAGVSARTTHGAAECIEACELLASMICAALCGRSKEETLFAQEPKRFQSAKVRAIAAGDYRDKSVEMISGSGYVIHCLEASAWCFWNATSFREAVLLGVNLGDDAETTGAVCGQIAGAFYGEDGIPREWLSRLAMADEIRCLADRLDGSHEPLTGRQT